MPLLPLSNADRTRVFFGQPHTVDPCGQSGSSACQPHALPVPSSPECTQNAPGAHILGSPCGAAAAGAGALSVAATATAPRPTAVRRLPLASLRSVPPGRRCGCVR